jgi:hypothetical protein
VVRALASGSEAPLPPPVLVRAVEKDLLAGALSAA